MNLNAPNVPQLQAVGGYHILRPIAVGGMSVVYAAFDPRHKRAVAIKVLSEELATHKEFVRRFTREGRLGRKLDHANIVRVWDAGFDSEMQKYFLAMELIDGTSAFHRLGKSGALAFSDVIRIGRDLTRALAYLHGQGWIHRDVKPENILLPHNGPAKLADLGLAKRQDTTGDLTAFHQGIGTPNYMPYEQSLNASFADERSDLFALGATLYHLATGRLPFTGKTNAEQNKNKIDNNMLKASGHNHALPAAFDRFLAKAMAFDVRLRFSSAEELDAELARMETVPDTSSLSDTGPLDLNTSPTKVDLR